MNYLILHYWDNYWDIIEMNYFDSDYWDELLDSDYWDELLDSNYWDELLD